MLKMITKKAKASKKNKKQKTGSSGEMTFGVPGDMNTKKEPFAEGQGSEGDQSSQEHQHSRPEMLSRTLRTPPGGPPRWRLWRKDSNTSPVWEEEGLLVL